jgi:Uma2 family endonuclease
MTPGIKGGDNSTLKLQLGYNVPQADAYLRILAECGGQCRIEEGYVVGAPDLIGEIAASSASYDLHDKLRTYQRNGVQEYVVWRTEDQAIDWFVLKAGKFHRLTPGKDGVLKSKIFPGLWLDAAALLRGDLAAVLKTLQKGLDTKEHQRFVEKLQKK